MEGKLVTQAPSQRKDVNKLKEQYNVSRIWSFSRINAFCNCPYSYYLKYVKREKELTNNIYAVLGGHFHDILEKFYLGQITYEDMINEAEMAIMNATLMEMKFNNNDAEQNKSIEDKYFGCIKHFFNNHIPVKEKVLCEKHIMIKIGSHYFQGYIDAIHTEKDTYIITDYKSSTLYTGQKINKEGKQLMLYALGLYQKGVPVDKIKIRWNFLKYNSISFMQKNGNPKTMHSERWAWAGKLKSKLRSNLKDTKLYSDDEIEGLLAQCMESNSLDCLSQEIQDKYTLSDCYIYIPLDEDVLKNIEAEVLDIVHEIYKKEALFDKVNAHIKDKKTDVNVDDSMWIKHLTKNDFYFCSNICSYTAHQCKHYKQFLEDQLMFRTKPVNVVDDNDDDEEILKMLGLD